MSEYRLYQGDCLEVMDGLIKEGIKVDMVLTDPPYGTTSCKWDSVIPLDEMWKRLNKLIKPNGVIVLFGSEPFSSNLRKSNIKNKNDKYLKPSLDHIIPKSKGGTDDLDNLQVLTWFENRCKNDMTEKEWNNMKERIGDYLI